MATSGSFTTTSYEGRSLTFSWSRTSTNIANNTSTIAWSVTGSGSYTAGWVTCGDIDVVINGTTVYNSSSDNRVNVWREQLLQVEPLLLHIMPMVVNHFLSV